MKKPMVAFAVGLFLFGMATTARSTPIEWEDNPEPGIVYQGSGGTGTYDIYTFTGSLSSLAPGTFDFLRFELDGFALGSWEYTHPLWWDTFHVKVTYAGSELLSLTQQPSGSFQPLSIGFNLPEFTTDGLNDMIITAWATTNDGSEDWRLDRAILWGNHTPAPVPEPSTFLLLGGGLAGLAFVARRRRKE